MTLPACPAAFAVGSGAPRLVVVEAGVCVCVIAKG